MILYTADQHFGHANIIHHDHRPFNSAEEMDEYLITMWNGRVQNNDEVYIIGDFAFRNTDSAEIYLKRLKGRKHLIIGNHDLKLLKDETAMAYFETVDQIKEINDDGKRIILCHYPIAEWNGYYHGSWLIYGHIHNNKNAAFEFLKDKQALNAGCMINGYAPCSFEELVKNNREFKQSEVGE